MSARTTWGIAREQGDPATGAKVPARPGMHLMPEGGKPGAGWNAQGAVNEITVKPAGSVPASF